MTDKDELFKGIDEAANSLFDQYIVKKPATPPPATQPEVDLELGLEIVSDSISTKQESTANPEVEAEIKPEVVTEAKPEEEAATEVELDLSINQEPESGGNSHLFGGLEEALLSIDWEVSQNTIQKGQEALAKLIDGHGWPATSPLRKVAEQMGLILTSMLNSPENFPTSAPSLLRNAMLAIKGASSTSGTPDADTSKLVDESLADLENLLSSEMLSETDPSVSDRDNPQAATPTISTEEPNSSTEPTFDLGLEMSIGNEDTQSTTDEMISEATAATLNSYGSVLAESIKLLTPMENLFASRPAMAKLHSAAQQLKAKLTGQQNLLEEAFSSDYYSYTGLGSVHGWIGSQRDVLKNCINRISKLEKLFGKTKGYEKLFTRSKRIRQILEKEFSAITVAIGGEPTQHQFDLTGEYPAIIQPSTPKEPEAPAAVVSAIASPASMVEKCISLAKSLEENVTDDPQAAGLKIRKTLEKLKVAISGAALHSPSATAAANTAFNVAGHSTKCHWDWLLKTSWGGQLTGFAPEQVVFESKSTFPASAFIGQTTFKLKKLKSMPWTNLRAMLSGELAELDNSELNSLELEISQPPASFPGSTKKKVYITILYSGGKGKVYLIDSATEAISVAEEALWSPGTSQTDIAGTLTVYGTTMPVISIG